MTLPKVILNNNEAIAYRKRPGGKQAIILVHGNMTSSKHWDVLMDALDSKYTVYALDLRGFGESSYNERITQIKDFSDDLKGFVDVLGLRDFYLIGWSTGGAVCMQFEVDYPGYCQKLILLASASTRGYPFFGTKADGTPDLEARLRTIEDVEQDTGKTLAIQGLYDTRNREGLKAVWNALIYTHNKPGDEKYEEYIDDMLTQRNLADVYHSLNTFNISGKNNGLSEGTNQAKNLRVPILILRGDRDYVVTEQMTKEIEEDLGNNATYIPLVNTGHSPLVDDLPKLKELIENFLE
ncbi:alpha/beta hydrolase [Sporosarcina sp. Marseille-Q4063]|uniref:intracellular short-chain-length polyhydroxyalkanoate depolymerase n=1 Tax=Sporosarcina sp. Marseille-Q4063 TaxID=2810514 RepID=UPI001BB03AC9|nr:alpha/beta hydrolase [Sporosarcina sp. Marseille-Q4063]QUW22341.1 alpha/beta hydrolase [Sporosarcina sp. Marseille-Q4063]